MLAQGLRHWPIIKTALDQRLVIVGQTLLLEILIYMISDRSTLSVRGLTLSVPI